MLEPTNTNGISCVLAGGEGVLLVDVHFQSAVAEIIAEVEKLSDQDIKFVVNTHVHPDHICGNSLLSDYGVTIVAHDLVRLQILEELRIPRRAAPSFRCLLSPLKRFLLSARR